MLRSIQTEVSTSGYTLETTHTLRLGRSEVRISFRPGRDVAVDADPSYSHISHGSSWSSGNSIQDAQDLSRLLAHALELVATTEATVFAAILPL